MFLGLRLLRFFVLAGHCVLASASMVDSTTFFPLVFFFLIFSLSFAVLTMN